MDYTSQNFLFKLRKVLRYFRLYGIPRTLVKVKGQYHMQRVYECLPAVKPSKASLRSSVAIVGCGNYSFSNIAFYLSRSGIGIRCVMDIDINKAASLAQHYNACYYTCDVEDLLDDDSVELVYIASNHASHADYAVRFISAGKNVHIEKPHVVSNEQLISLCSAMRSYPTSKVFLGFNRPRSVLMKSLVKQLASQSGPLMINWFIAGHEIPDDHWYFLESEGGRVLGNLCHWTDCTLQLVGLDKAFPCTVHSVASTDAKSDFIFSVVFADQSCATISFSAKGHTFEGVRETLNLHKGDILANISDFQSLRIDVSSRKFAKRIPFRDHGHKSNVLNSFSSASGEPAEYIFATAKFFLAFKESLERRSPVTVSIPSDLLS